MRKKKFIHWVDDTHYYFGNALVTIHPEMRTNYNLSSHVVYWQTTKTNERVEAN